jgi:hypothetical protein
MGTKPSKHEPVGDISYSSHHSGSISPVTWCRALLHLLTCHCVSSLVRCLLKSLTHFLIEQFIFLLLSFKNSFYILDNSPSSDVGLFPHIFFQSLACLFTLLIKKNAKNNKINTTCSSYRSTSCWYFTTFALSLSWVLSFYFTEPLEVENNMSHQSSLSTSAYTS